MECGMDGLLEGVGRVVAALMMDIFYVEMATVAAALVGTALLFWTWRKLQPVCRRY
jgi:UDP-N-acetylmuramyl pentapeptide phosphotransferase/UDP-N-acetylglucosamine-1-phosphate transferase